MSRLATLDAGAWWIEGFTHARRRGAQHASIAGLYRVMIALGIDTLHVHASALPSLGLPAELDVPLPGQRRERHPFLDCELDGARPSHSALSPWVELVHHAGPRAIGFGAYQSGAGDPFAEARDGRELLAAHLAFAEALEDRGRRWDFRHSAILTGWKLMHAPWEAGSRRRRRPLDGPNPQPQLEGHPEGAQVEIPYGGAWARPREAPAHPYVAAWDVNGQRLAACSRLALGTGALEHMPAGDAELKLPGYHRVTAVRDPFPGEIPMPFEPGWHTTPRVAMARYLGVPIELSESWVWREQAPYLDPFYARMRVARERLRAELGQRDRPVAIALDALKQTYLQPFGRLRSGKLRESSDVRYRPAWYDSIIGQELAREYLRLHQLAAAGERVLAVYFDAIVCEVPARDYVPAAIELSDQLGKFKPIGVLPAEQAHATLYRAGGEYDVGELVKALKAGEAPEHPPSTSPALSVFSRPAHGGFPDPAGCDTVSTWN